MKLGWKRTSGALNRSFRMVTTFPYTHNTLERLTILEMGEKMMSNKALTFNNSRCIYENDDILVEHSVMGFPDGTREAVLVVHTKKEGKIIRTETGATPLT
jgi:hypothetical protein